MRQSSGSRAPVWLTRGPCPAPGVGRGGSWGPSRLGDAGSRWPLPACARRGKALSAWSCGRAPGQRSQLPPWVGLLALCTQEWPTHPDLAQCHPVRGQRPSMSTGEGAHSGYRGPAFSPSSEVGGILQTPEHWPWLQRRVHRPVPPTTGRGPATPASGPGQAQVLGLSAKCRLECEKAASGSKEMVGTAPAVSSCEQPRGAWATR